MTIFTLFFVVLVANFECAALLQNKNTRIGPFPWKRSVLQNPDRERTNQSTGICLGLGLPYNTILYIKPWTLWHLNTYLIFSYNINHLEFCVILIRNWQVPTFKLEAYGSRSFSYIVPYLWNQLPNAIRQAQSHVTCKSNLKTYLFDQVFNI